MDKAVEKAFEFASDLVKQIITLSTGVITITVTFAKDLFGVEKGNIPCLLTSAWVSLFLAIVFGVWALMALTGTLDPPQRNSDSTPTIQGSNCRIPVSLQILSFLVGLALTLAYATSAP